MKIEDDGQGEDAVRMKVEYKDNDDKETSPPVKIDPKIKIDQKPYFIDF